MTTWYRFGDFYQPVNYRNLADQSYGPVMMRSVKFRSISSPIIKVINVILYTDGDVRICITPTQSYKQKFHTAARCIIPKDAFDTVLPVMSMDLNAFMTPDKDVNPYSFVGHDVRINIAGGTNKNINLAEIIDKVEALFKDINKQCEQYVFTDELSVEIRQIVEFVYNSVHGKKYQHMMTDKLVTHSHTHPERKNSKELIRILSKLSTLTENDKKEFRYFLTQGENPDQAEPAGMQAISLAIIRQKSKELTNALMFYGASIFTRNPDTVFFESPFELTMKLYSDTKNSVYLDMLNMMGGMLTTLERQIARATSGVKVVNTEITCDANSITTTFNMSDGKTLDTVLKHNSQLTRGNKQAILDSIDGIFDKSNVEAYLGNNYFIESIYSGSKLVGFNIFEIVPPDHAKDTDIILHVAYSFIQAPYRGYGIMALLEFRLAYAMQVLSNQHDVSVFYTAIDPSGYKQAKDHLAMPRHQPPDMDEKMHKVLSKVYHGSYQYYHDGSMCFVLDDASANVGGFTGSKTDLTHQYVFENMLDSTTKEASGKTRGVPVLFYIGDENYIKQSQIAEQIGVNFTDHILRLANAMRHVVSPYTGQACHSAPNLGRVYKRTDLLFWKYPSDVAEKEQSHSLRAKL